MKSVFVLSSLICVTSAISEIVAIFEDWKIKYGKDYNTFGTQISFLSIR